MSTEHERRACQACQADIGQAITLKCEAEGDYYGNIVTFFRCDNCGFTFAPANGHSYGSEHDFSESSRPLRKHGRVGTASRPGREFQMAAMAVAVLERAGHEVDKILVYGAGLSQDHAWISKEFPQKSVHVCDLDNFQKVGNFIAADDVNKFDVVVACEVVEHFTDLDKDFYFLLSKVKDDGMAVLSTNISDGSALPKLAYPFIKGHTAYYSGRALNYVAKRIDPRYIVDFRVPQAALAQLGARKRYVLMYRSPSITQAIGEYFAEHLFAPSEPALQWYYRPGLKRLLRRVTARVLPSTSR